MSPGTSPRARNVTPAMVNSSFFSDLLASVTERGRSLLRQKAWPDDPAGQAAHMIEACETVLSGRGEASGAPCSPS